MEEKEKDDWFLEISESDSVGFDEAKVLQIAASRIYDRAEKLELEAAMIAQATWKCLIRKYDLRNREYAYIVTDKILTRSPLNQGEQKENR